MTRASKLAMLAALFALPVGGAGETCSSTEPEPSRSLALLQVTRRLGATGTGTSATEDVDRYPGHRLLLLARQHENGTYVMPVKPRHASQLQRTAGVQGTSAPSAEMQDVLESHNLYRCMHNVPPMTWDSAIAANAQAWADAGSYGHSSQEARNLANVGQIGENLAWGYPTRTGLDSVQAWYDEIIFTDGTPESCDDTNPGAGHEAICHYTQVVWRSSTKLGCGKGKAAVAHGQTTYDGDFWVCQYGQAGNYGGQFASNVLPPVKTAAECTPPAPAPTPAPQLTEVTEDPDCKDGAATESPVITYSDGTMAECADLAWACASFPFVPPKCKKTCNAC